MSEFKGGFGEERKKQPWELKKEAIDKFTKDALDDFKGAYEKVPTEMRDRVFLVQAVVESEKTKSIFNRIPDDMKTKDFLLTLLKMRPRYIKDIPKTNPDIRELAIQAISAGGHRVELDVYEAAGINDYPKEGEMLLEAMEKDPRKFESFVRSESNGQYYDEAHLMRQYPNFSEIAKVAVVNSIHGLSNLGIMPVFMKEKPKFLLSCALERPADLDTFIRVSEYGSSAEPCKDEFIKMVAEKMPNELKKVCDKDEKLQKYTEALLGKKLE
ncbi:MAG: hypothetical protein WCG28_02435 [bacterium]